MVLAAAGGCDNEASDETARPDSGPSASPTPDGADATDRCPNEDRAPEQGEPIGGEAGGDVDGDGTDDGVRLVLDESGPLGCRIFLVAETSAGPLVVSTTDTGAEYSLPEPRVHSLVQVDGEGGNEVLVELEQGASSRFIGIFTVAGGELQRVRVADETGFGDLFPYGGSVGHMEASNCVDHPKANVLMAIATPNATDYAVRARLYDMQGAELVPLPRPQQPRIERSRKVAELEGFATSPFGDCPVSG